jgi:hypothetical protein
MLERFLEIFQEIPLKFLHTENAILRTYESTQVI